MVRYAQTEQRKVENLNDNKPTKVTKPKSLIVRIAKIDLAAPPPHEPPSIAPTILFHLVSVVCAVVVVDLQNGNFSPIFMLLISFLSFVKC